MVKKYKKTARYVSDKGGRRSKKADAEPSLERPKSVARDPRKPQLGSRPSPLSSKARRASSDGKTPVESSPSNPLGTKSQMRFESAPSYWVPWRILGWIALASLTGSGAMHADGDYGLWMTFTDITSSKPMALCAAIMLAVSVVSGVLAAAQKGLRVGLSETMLPSFALMLSAGCAALLAALSSGSATSSAALAPMRASFGAVPLEVWAGILAGALLGISERGRSSLHRQVAALGIFGLFANGWIPIGFAGQIDWPLFMAISQPLDLSAEAIQTQAWCSHPWAALILSLAALPGTIALCTPRCSGKGWLTIAALLTVLTPALLCVLTISDENTVQSIAGHLLVALGATTIVGAATAVTLDRLVTRWDDENLIIAEWMIVAIVLAVWTLAKINGMGLSATDEGIYFYASKAWADGVWPYHDYFFSHPPLHILIPTLLFSAFGFSVPLAKSIAVIATAIAGIFVWRIGRRWFNPVSGLFAMGFFIFAGEVLKSSANLTGINLTTMWAVIGLWATFRGNSFRAGVLFGLAACTGFYSVGYALILFVLSLFRPYPPLPTRSGTLSRILVQPGLRLALGFALVFGALNLIFYLVAGQDYLTGVYRYHFLKRAKLAGFTPLSEGLHAFPANLVLMLKGHDFRVTTYYHGLQLTFAALAPLGLAAVMWMKSSPAKAFRHQWLWNVRLWWRKAREGGATLLLMLIALGMLTEFAQFKERYDFYYTLVLPPLCLLAGGWLHYAWTLVTMGVEDERPLDTDEEVDLESLHRGSPQMIRIAALAAMLVTGLWVPVSLWANNTAWKSEVTSTSSSRGAGEVLRFDWTPAPGPLWVSSLTKRLLWKDHRVRGSLESSLHHFLWSKKRSFSTAPEIAKYIREHSKSSDTITGASTYAPMVALLADRRMAADHVDTNSKTFKTRVVSPSEFWQRACSDRLRYILAAPRSYFSARAMRRRPSVARQFSLVKQFRDPLLKHWREVTLELWERRKGLESCSYLRE